ncbi:molybdate ABC transporter substrate-binding protein [Duganella qianjiadongensis]|uniref:Molybdate ABC transporter substrate-binding protein n=1 Tax=Duganella qianjiadongensis TaxID=2692176 RepID=A0ABW9VH50_9BURK|nr:molybdate ABC transporter substrate-binding protein [Duganella qianjiadongensis]
MSGQAVKHTVLALSVLVVSMALAPARAAELTVSAAASLSNAFKEIAAAYEKQHGGDKVQFNFAASDALLQQIAKGAPVDVFASADQETMDKAEGMKLLAAGSRTNFASNTLVLIKPADSKYGVGALRDLAQAGVQRIAIGNPASVPAGRYARQAMEQAGLWNGVLNKLIYATSVRQSLDYVARGEVDAGFVYATDAALFKDKVQLVATVPTATPVTYPIAVVASSTQAQAARQFSAFVQSAAAQTILARYGFGRP